MTFNKIKLIDEILTALEEDATLDSISNHITCICYAPNFGYRNWIFKYKSLYILLFDEGNGYYQYICSLNWFDVIKTKLKTIFERKIKDNMSNIQSYELDAEVKPRETKVNLSVFTYPWSWKSWTGFWRNIQCFFRNIKKMFQRAKRGYCYSDTYDCGDTMIDYIIALLTGFRNRVDAYPAEDFASFEEWIAYLDFIIDELQYANTCPDELNKWWGIWCELREKENRNFELEDRVYGLYREKLKEIQYDQQKRLEEAMVRLSLYIKDLWW